MTELKTLKDLGFSHIITKEDLIGGKSQNQQVYVDFIEYSNQIKQEAIEWVKYCSSGYSWKENHKRCDGCKWFIKFFNITPQELENA